MGNPIHSQTGSLEEQEPKMKTFSFVSTSVIEAESEDEAKRIFADNSTDFAANASCVELTK